MRFLGRSGVLALCALALFYFVFLGSEFFFDSSMALLVDAPSVVAAQSLVLGASVCGFFLFPVLHRFVPRLLGRVLAIAGVIIAIASLVVILQNPSPFATQSAGCIAFVLFGCAGGYAHWAVAQTVGTVSIPSQLSSQPDKGTKQAGGEVAKSRDRSVLARCVGLAYAAGLLMQFASNTLVVGRAAEVLVLGVATAALVALLACARLAPAAVAELATDDVQSKAAPLKKAGLLVLVVVLMTCLFSTLDNVVTLADAQGSINVETWPRLFLAASGIVAGFVFDATRRYQGVVMFCIMLLSTACILAIEGGGSPLLGLIVFYLGSGFYVVFFTSIFLRLSLQMRVPELWAGMGRVANNACSILTVTPSLMLVQSGNIPLIIAIELVLFVAVTVVLCASGLINLHGETADTKKGVPVLNLEDRAAHFAGKYGLTQREAEVLAAVVCDEKPLKQIASDQDVSLRTLQHHLTSIYRKTDTQTRAGLISCFLSDNNSSSA